MQNRQDADIRERLRGKRILVLGPESDMKQKFLQVFRGLASGVSEDENDMSPEDYVILFGAADRMSPEKAPGAGTGGTREKNSGGDWEGFFHLTGILRKIGDVRPEAALLISRSDVYGKLFGTFHPVRENEMGYVCHTSAGDQEASRLRLLEHLCGRMAREDGTGIRIARFPDLRAADSKAACRDWKKIAELTARILLDGAAGEAYNVESSLQTAPEEEERIAREKDTRRTMKEEGQKEPGRNRPASADTSALEPFRIVMDTGKAGRLG